MKNKINEIRRLLNLYYEGETTQEEETQLIVFFEMSKNIPEDLDAEKAIFLNLQKVSESILPSNDFEDRLLKVIENRERHKMSSVWGRFHRWKKISVAACLSLMVFGVVTYLIFDKNNNPYEITDERLAYDKTKEALLLVSTKLTKVDVELNKMNYTLNKLKNSDKK